MLRKHSTISTLELHGEEGLRRGQIEGGWIQEDLMTELVIATIYFQNTEPCF